MRADRAQNNRTERRGQNRSACGQRVCCRASRGRDDQAIGPIRAKIIVIDVSLQINNAAPCAFSDDSIVEHSERMWLTLVALNNDFEGHSLFGLVVAVKRLSQNRL